MKILTNNNSSFDLNLASSDDDIYCCVLDYSNPIDADYVFEQVLILETYNSPTVQLKIGKHTIQMPIDWYMLVGDKHSGEMEVIPLSSLSGREFDAFTINPIDGFYPEFQSASVEYVYPDNKWYMPSLTKGKFLAIPLDDKTNICAYFIRNVAKLPDIDIGHLV